MKEERTGAAVGDKTNESGQTEEHLVMSEELLPFRRLVTILNLAGA